MTKLTSRFDEALLYARAVHGDQQRKGTPIPYFPHLMGVASIAIELGATEDQAVAALLHDTVEDQGGKPRLEDIRVRFGGAVADIVDACSDTDVAPKPPWRSRKESYLAHLETASPDGLLVSLSDKIHNAEAILSDLRTIGETVWSRFSAGRDDQLWYYGALADVFERRMPGQGSLRLSAAVRNIRDAATGAAGQVAG